MGQCKTPGQPSSKPSMGVYCCYFQMFLSLVETKGASPGCDVFHTRLTCRMSDASQTPGRPPPAVGVPQRAAAHLAQPQDGSVPSVPLFPELLIQSPASSEPQWEEVSAGNKRTLTPCPACPSKGSHSGPCPRPQ